MDNKSKKPLNNDGDAIPPNMDNSNLESISESKDINTEENYSKNIGIMKISPVPPIAISASEPLY